MSRFLRMRPSPAMVVACVALSFALAGSAVAGTETLTSKLDKKEKKQVKRIAKKQANKRINARESGLRVAHAATADNATNATNATHATNATNAQTVGGKTAAALESHGFSVTNESVPITAGPSSTNVQTLDLPAGTYLILGRAEFNNDNAAPSDNGLDCELRAGATVVDLARNMFLGANLDPGESEVGAGHLVHTFNAAGQAQIVCDANASWVAGSALDPTISAVSLQP